MAVNWNSSVRGPCGLAIEVSQGTPATAGLFPGTAPGNLLGLIRDTWGPTFRRTLLASLPGQNKLLLVRPRSAPDSMECYLEDFLSNTRHEFHPGPFLEDADGSLLLLDRGGRGPDAPGNIYRIRSQAVPPMDDPWGLRSQE